MKVISSSPSYSISLLFNHGSLFLLSTRDSNDDSFSLLEDLGQVHCLLDNDSISFSHSHFTFHRSFLLSLSFSRIWLLCKRYYIIRAISLSCRDCDRRRWRLSFSNNHIMSVSVVTISLERGETWVDMETRELRIETSSVR